jgi:hypothetical protein
MRTYDDTQRVRLHVAEHFVEIGHNEAAMDEARGALMRTVVRYQRSRQVRGQHEAAERRQRMESAGVWPELALPAEPGQRPSIDLRCHLAWAHGAALCPDPQKCCRDLRELFVAGARSRQAGEQALRGTGKLESR